MRKKVGLLPVLLVLGCMLIGFFWVSSKLVTGISETGVQYQQAVAMNSSLETKQNKLKDMLASVNTDAFIENQARTLYDYMKPDELRLVITNPEVLYGTGGQ